MVKNLDVATIKGNSIRKEAFHLILIVFLFLFSASNITAAPEIQPPIAIEGVIDLQNYNFEKDGSINLSGQWNFFWSELLNPDQLTDYSNSIYVSVPDKWTNYQIDNVNITAKGWATYSLNMLVPDDNQIYGIYIKSEGSAYKLWIDGQLMAYGGQLGTSLKTETPNIGPVRVFFEPENDKVEIVVQISNYHHRKAGFRNAFLLGLAEPVHQQMQNWIVAAISIAIFFIMGLYHLFLFIFQTRDKSPLYFAIICWLLTVRGIAINKIILLYFIPSMSWTLAFRLEYLTFFIIPLLFTLFMRSLYPKELNPWFMRIIIGIVCSFSLFLLFTSTITLSYAAPYFQYFILGTIIYWLFFLVRILIHRREGAYYIALASFLLFITVIMETLYFRDVVNLGHVTTLGFLAFIFVQAILLSFRFSKSFTRVESLSVELKETNINLEHSEKKYRNIFNDSKDVIFITTMDTTIEDISPSCKEILGYTKEELIDKKVEDIMVNPAEISLYIEKIREKKSIKNIEVYVQKKDGKDISTLVSVSYRQDEKGTIIGVQGTLHDLSAIKEAEAERLNAQKLEQISITDPLTGIYNRRYLFQEAEKEIDRAKRQDEPLTVIFFDIDHFKIINDTYGHLIGDQILIGLTALCQKHIRNIDILTRFGGEEFVILMPATDINSAEMTAERLRKIVSETPLTKFKSKEISITISLGIALWKQSNSLDFNELLEQADNALYQSKEGGRNQVTIFSEG
ncbi:MAG: diguanylate cyclase [Spirochaetaceae bacterium]